MGQRIWRYTLSRNEQTLWETEEMKGWREAMQAYVEDEAREQGCKKYIMYGRRETVVAKGNVNKLVLPVHN
ncbi:MAG TPA: hypothetical protein PLI09_28555 [Candidatus Hydrogenedentes bacterium]|nr:hypothetical protein [Candidatus Hydrogenedentota bacterium]